MLDSYKYSREEILVKLKNCPTTPDGHIFCKSFKRWNNARGDHTDKGYSFNRRFFSDKICFDKFEIEVYMDREESHFDIYRMRKKDDFLYKTIKDDLKLKLAEEIKNTEYTLGELIDNTIFYFNVKY